MKKIFLFVLPLLFILIYILSAMLPSISNKFGGPSELSNFLIVLLTYFYVVLTGIMVRQMIENQKLERRPYIIADLDFVEHLVWFTLKNIGRTPASNIKVRIEPELKTIDKKNVSEILFNKPIKFFPPNKEFRSFINTSIEILKDENPQEFRIYLDYQDVERKEKFSESYLINIENQKNRSFVSKKGIEDIYKILEKINDNLRKMSK